MEARAGNPASPMKSLIINDLRKADFGLLYHLFVSKPGELGKGILAASSCALPSCHRET